MEFEVQRGAKVNIEKYEQSELDVAYKFSRKAFKELGTFVKAIVLFGSMTRNDKPPSKKGDIDILVVVDDIAFVMKPEVVETYRIVTARLIHDVSERIHLTTLKLTSFWEYVRAGDPIAINMLRDGVAVIDTGFFQPLQMLLRHGRIRPTQEAMWSYFVRAPATMQNSKWHILQASLDLYWAVIDSAHAALMKQNKIPATPEHVADMIRDVLVKEKKVSKTAPATMDKFYKLMKDITHRNIKEVSGQQYDALRKEAQTFVEQMQKVVENN